MTMTCSCAACLQRHRNGLPSLVGISVHPGMHLLADDLPDAREVTEAERRAVEDCRRSVGRNLDVATTKPRRYVRIKVLAEVVRVLRDETAAEVQSLQRRLSELEQRVGFERRLTALEARTETSMPVDEMAPWEPRHASWKDRQ